MLFNSLEFALFFAVVAPLYFFVGLRARQVLLLAASLFFYMYWNAPYVALLVGSGMADYIVGLRLGACASPRARRRWLTVSVCVNLGVLSLFKYYNFFLDSIRSTGVALDFLPASELLLPLGISFYTFQTMSYTIDVYRGRIEPEKDPLRLLLYVSFFPQLVAGPIVRASELLPQLRVFQPARWDNMVLGGQRVLTGLVKKVVVADSLAPLVEQAYGAPAEYSSVALLLATYAFAVQIYCDFSGYSDIAIGLARILGFRFNENFNAPYISASIQEFWRRWHISLSTWLRDYLYISIGGNRGGTLRTYRNLLITMVLGGLWHGASMNFLVWGTLHGTWLAAERAFSRTSPRATAVGSAIGAASRAVKTILVFHGVCLTWVFFRAQTLTEASSILSRIAGGAGGRSLPGFEVASAFFVIAATSVYFYADWRARRNSYPRPALWTLGLYGVALMTVLGASGQDFIYFVF